jgi:hypothetical protein
MSPARRRRPLVALDEVLARARWVARWPSVRRALLVLCMAALSALFFGICVPFFLLAMKVLPSLSYAGVVYVLAGGLFGLLFGGVTSAVSLARSERPVTRYYAVLFGTLAALTLAYYVAYLKLETLQHV